MKLILLGCVAIILASCTPESSNDRATLDSASIYNSIPQSPVYSPVESLELFRLDSGLQLSLIASEPLIEDPVAIDFDEKGRIWVVEMRGYMPDTLGTGENKPVGRIKIVEDDNGDGTMDHSTVVVDSLVMPRALRLVYGGLLYAEPPNLWFATIENDRMTSKTLVDSVYAVGGNVEHQPNGLIIGLDNWIYSAKSTKRYRMIKGRWVIQDTEFRGQWGITMDDQGNLFYNDNSNQLMGDFYPPGTSANNKIMYKSSGIGTQIVTDQKVFPARSTPGINRGYIPGMLDDSLKLTRFTAACGPLIYRGTSLGQTYLGNAFVAEPAANLIKRNLLKYEGLNISGTQAYSDREFLTSLDERFRPVNLHNSPDGALYIVDMYRGVVQHVTYLTDYLKSEIRRRELDRPIGLGRIYKIKRKGSVDKTPDLANVNLENLGHSNGWIRDFTQRKLIETAPEGIVKQLTTALKESSNELLRIHAIWTLEGLEALDPTLFYDVKSNERLVQHLVRALSGDLPKAVYTDIIDFVLESNNEEILFSSLRLFTDIPKSDSARIVSQVLDFSNTLDDQNTGADLRISILGLQSVYYGLETQDSLILKKLDRTRRTSDLVIEGFERGNQLFSQMCSVCHGNKGEGIKGLGPPFIDSEWISGDEARLAAILLYGLKGPISVNGVRYKPPSIAPIMPGLSANEEIRDEDYLELIRFLKKNFADQDWVPDIDLLLRIKQDFGHDSSPLTPDSIVNYSK